MTPTASNQNSAPSLLRIFCFCFIPCSTHFWRPLKFLLAHHSCQGFWLETPNTRLCAVLCLRCISPFFKTQFIGTFSFMTCLPFIHSFICSLSKTKDAVCAVRSNQQVVRARERGGRAPARGPEGGEAGRASSGYLHKVSREAVDRGGTRETPGSWKGGTGTVHRPEALLQRSSGWALPFIRQALPWVGLPPLSARLWSPPPHSL